MSREERKPKKQFVNNHYKPFTAKTKKQKELFNALDSFDVVFAYGSAGTGKTACVVSKACEFLQNGKVDKIIVTRPAVEAGESLGFLPGTIEEKYEQWIAPVRGIMNEILGRATVEAYLKGHKIEAIPLAYCRGLTFNNAFMILDEAQNTTPNQMRMFLTRIGEDSKIAVTGDSAQIDITGLSGLVDAIDKISWMPSVKTVEFSRDDIVRNSIISDILQSYDHPVKRR